MVFLKPISKGNFRLPLLVDTEEKNFSMHPNIHSLPAVSPWTQRRFRTLSAYLHLPTSVRLAAYLAWQTSVLVLFPIMPLSHNLCVLCYTRMSSFVGPLNKMLH